MMGNSKTKPDGWHSRRHETSAAQDAARERYANRADERPVQVWVPFADGSGGSWVHLNRKGY
jgi:hypothetical protein